MIVSRSMQVLGAVVSGSLLVCAGLMARPVLAAEPAAVEAGVAGSPRVALLNTGKPGGWFGYYGFDVSSEQRVAGRFTVSPSGDYQLTRVGVWLMNNSDTEQATVKRQPPGQRDGRAGDALGRHLCRGGRRTARPPPRSSPPASTRSTSPSSAGRCGRGPLVGQLRRADLHGSGGQGPVRGSSHRRPLSRGLGLHDLRLARSRQLQTAQGAGGRARDAGRSGGSRRRGRAARPG